MDLAAFFDSKARWSAETFGPGSRYAGVVAHIRKELAEIEATPSDLYEWVDVVLLAMDGAWRAAGADGETFCKAMREKDTRNRLRTWPDWRTLGQGQISEHVKPPDRRSSREDLLARLVMLAEIGTHDHTGVVNELGAILDDEATASEGEAWVTAYRAIPEPR